MWFIGLLPTDRPASKLLFKSFICFTLPIRVLVNNMYTRNSTLPGTESPGSHCEVKIQEFYSLKEFWYYLVHSPYLNKWGNWASKRSYQEYGLQSFFSLQHIFPSQNIFLCLYLFPTLFLHLIYPVYEYWLLRSPFHTFPFNFSWPSQTLPRSTLNGIL